MRPELRQVQMLDKDKGAEKLAHSASWKAGNVTLPALPAAPAISISPERSGVHGLKVLSNLKPFVTKVLTHEVAHSAWRAINTFEPTG